MDVSIRILDRNDVPEAERIFRLAFGTFIGLPDPLSFTGDAAVVRTRWLANPAAGLGAFVDGSLVGSNFAACEAMVCAPDVGLLVAGVNTARYDAYRIMLARGFRPFLLGVAMQRPNQPGLNRPDCFVVDDWR